MKKSTRIAKMKTCLICNKETPRLGRHISDHSISQKDYYDLYLNKNNSLICSNEECDKETEFSNINIGYKKYCSVECCMIHRNSDPIFKSKLSVQLKTYNESELGKLNTMLTLDNRQRTTFIRLSKSKGFQEGIFYIMKFSEFIKIGICRYDEDLNYFKTRKYKLKPLSYKLFRGDIEDIANFELKIKSDFTSIKDREYFKLNLLEVIESILPSSLLLIKESSTTISKESTLK